MSSNKTIQREITHLTSVSEESSTSKMVYKELDSDLREILTGVMHRRDKNRPTSVGVATTSASLPDPDFRHIAKIQEVPRVHDILAVYSIIRARTLIFRHAISETAKIKFSCSKAQQFLTEVLESGTASSLTYYKILLLGIRDAYLYHRDRLKELLVLSKADSMKEYYLEALKFWKMSDRERAVYYLGGALYFLQDAWLGLSNDQSYEQYLEKTFEGRRDINKPDTMTKLQGAPEEWVKQGEKTRQKLNSSIKQMLKGQTRPEGDAVTPELAQKTYAAGASLILHFFGDAES